MQRIPRLTGKYEGEITMKKVAIVGLGWLGMPLARRLAGRGWQVTGSKTTPDGVQAARATGINACQLTLTPEPDCDANELAELLDADALVVTLPASRTAENSEQYVYAVQNIVDSALAHKVPHIIFTSSTSVYGDLAGEADELSELRPVTVAGQSLVRLEQWLHDLPGTRVDILRLAGLIGPGRHPGRFLAGKRGLTNGHNGVNLVHLDDVISAIMLLLEQPDQGGIYNLCAPGHPPRDQFYPQLARQAGWTPPEFDPQFTGGAGKQVVAERICRQRGFEYRWPDPYKMPLE